MLAVHTSFLTIKLVKDFGVSSAEMLSQYQVKRQTNGATSGAATNLIVSSCFAVTIVACMTGMLTQMLLILVGMQSGFV